MANKTEKYLSNDVTFVNSKNVSFQRWYPYIEGYSPDFVKTIIHENVPEAQLIYEPFAGTGTTLFAADAMKIASVYSEVNPLLRFLIDAKLEVLNLDETARLEVAAKLKDASDTILTKINRCMESEVLKESYKKAFEKSVYFPEETYSKILKLRTYLDNTKQKDVLLYELLTIACFSCLLPVSYLKKQGDVRFKTAKEKETQMKVLDEILPDKILQIAEDVENCEVTTSMTHNLICANAKQIGNIDLDTPIDAVITSPPYLNGTNYFRNTKLELWFLKELKGKESLRRFRDDALTSAICDVKKEYSELNVELGSSLFNDTFAKLKESAYDRRIPLMAKCYFAEMHELFSGLRKHLRPGAKLFIDLGDSIFGGVHIPTDLILTEVLESIGYKFDERIVLRERRSRNNEIVTQVLLKYTY